MHSQEPEIKNYIRRLRFDHGEMTQDQLAKQAGVTRQSIYRRWPSKLALVAELLREVSESAPLPDAGSLRDDLRALYRLYASY